MSEAPSRNDNQRPLDFSVIRRLYGYTKPFAGLRNTLIFLVVTRAILTPLVTWSIAAVISGPIARQEVGFVYRARYALRLGEAVVHDLRNEI
jgi:ATP-binding cassette, subfamily B, bacterial